MVLPGAAFVEKDGTAVNCERRVQRLSKVMDPPGEARTDFELLNGLLEAFNTALAVAGLTAAFGEGVQLHKDFGALSWEAIPVEGVQWPVSSEGEGLVRLAVPHEEKPVFKFFAARC